MAARFVRASATSARVLLMRAHAQAPTFGLTDEQAAEAAGLSLLSEYATRCSELLRMGFLEDTLQTRRSPESGLHRRVLRITATGQAALRDRDL